jgi:type 1 glutamine amidotransferase
MKMSIGLILAGLSFVAGLCEADALSVLVYSKTAGFRHGNAINAGVEVLQKMAAENGWELVATEDPNAFNTEKLADVDVIVFNNTTQNVLPEAAQREAFKAHINGGGGFVGIHAAADTLYDWEWYGKLVGTYFRGHPAGMPVAKVVIEDRGHPTMQGLPAEFEYKDEWYFWRHNPRPTVHVLATLDRASNPALTKYDNSPDRDHPIIWCNEFDGGRVWYTALGHERGPVTDERFIKMLKAGILWAADGK